MRLNENVEKNFVIVSVKFSSWWGKYWLVQGWKILVSPGWGKYWLVQVGGNTG